MTLLMYVSHSFDTGVVKGKDSRIFLNRLCTLDFKKHPPHHQALSFLLNAKGKLQGSFEVNQSVDHDPHSPLWRLHALSSEFIPSPPLSIEKVLQSLDLYHFGEELSFTLNPNQKRLILIGSPDQIHPLLDHFTLPLDLLSTLSSSMNLPDQNQNRSQSQFYTTIPFEEGHIGSYLPWFPSSSSSTLTRLYFEGESSWIDTLHTRLLQVETPPIECTAPLMIDVLRMQAVPLAPSEYRDQLNPLEIGLYGISEGKGCYPGQEVIERTLALGHPPRRFIFLKSESVFKANQDSSNQIELGIYSQDQEWVSVGQLTSWTTLSSTDFPSTEIDSLSSYAWGWVKYKYSQSDYFYTSNQQAWKIVKLT